MAVTWKKLAYEADIVTKALFDANTILAATSDDTPAAVAVAEQRLVGRITSGNITALTAAQTLTLLGLDPAGAKGYISGSTQAIPFQSWTKVRLNAEAYDIASELNTIVKTGTADATGANKLHDADGGFASSDVDAEIWNTTDNTYATVTAYVDSGELTLNNDIMVNGETYTLYHAKYTAAVAGYYGMNAQIECLGAVDQKYYNCGIYVNGTLVAVGTIWAAGTQGVKTFVSDTLYLAATDYVELYTYNSEVSGTRSLQQGVYSTYLSIIKVA